MYGSCWTINCGQNWVRTWQPIRPMEGAGILPQAKMVADCPYGGIIRSDPSQIRDTDVGFYGGDCKHVGIECLVVQAKKLLMHYGCPSNDGLKLKVFLEYLLVELGLIYQPLQVSYTQFEGWATEGWLKSFWEKYVLFGITVTFNDIPIEPPREKDQWLMAALLGAGFPAKTLPRLNRL